LRCFQTMPVMTLMALIKQPYSESRGSDTRCSLANNVLIFHYEASTSGTIVIITIIVTCHTVTEDGVRIGNWIY
jgi:hypothetical protein